MALKEGRCVNCGSILMLDPEMEKGHCLYCDAIFDNQKAFLIAQDPHAYEFPNEEQPKYTGPNLDPVAYRGKVDVQAFEQAVRQKQAKAKTETESRQLNLSDEKIPELNASRKQILLTISAFVALALLFLAIALPLTMRRDRIRDDLMSDLVEKVDINLDAGEDLLIRGMKNTDFVLSVSEKPSEEEALEYFTFFVEKRAALLDLDGKTMYEGVNGQIISPDGGYELFAQEAAADSVVVKELQ